MITMNRLRQMTQAIHFNVLIDRGLSCFPAAADDEDASEDHESGKNLLPCKYVHGEYDTDDGSDDRLDVAVHADKCRADAFLSVRYEEITHEGREYDQISKLPHLCRRDMYPFKRKYLAEGKGEGHQCREEEYPFHERYHRIFRDHRLEYAQI